MIKTYLKPNKGITLIAIVVTVIVLLILAGASIAFFSGDNGILNRAKIARESYNNGKDIEDDKLDKLNQIISGTTRGMNSCDESNIITGVDFEVTKLNMTSISIQISATASDPSKILGYHIFAVSKVDSSVIANMTKTTTFTIDGLNKNTTYTIYVKAFDTNDNYKVSVSKEGTTPSELYLYKYGDKCVDTTGGWSNSTYNTTGSTVFESDCIYMTSWQWGGQGVSPVKQIDYTNYSKYCYEITIYNVDGRPYIWNTLFNFTDNVDVNKHTFTCTKQVIKVDITSINGTKNIGFETNNNGSLRIYAVWLE